VTVGPVLSHEDRVLLAARSDPLAERDSVCLDDLAERSFPQAPGLPREMMDRFFPTTHSSGKPIRPVPVRSIEEMLMLIEAGQIVHPTIASFLDYYPDETIVAIPIRDLPPSETALIWLTSNRSPRADAFIRAATNVLDQTTLPIRRPA